METVSLVPPPALWHLSEAGDVRSLLSILHKSCEKQLSIHIAHCVFFSCWFMFNTYTVAWSTGNSCYILSLFWLNIHLFPIVWWLYNIFMESEHKGKIFCDFLVVGQTLGNVK